MKSFTMLLAGILLATTPIELAKAKDQKDEVVCEPDNQDCEGNTDRERAIKDLEKSIKKFQNQIECTEWESELIMNYLDDMYDTAKKLRTKADKTDDAKKLKKYVKELENISGLIDEDVGESIEDSQHECKNEKSTRCEIVKSVYKSFTKLEHALEHVEHEI